MLCSNEKMMTKRIFAFINIWLMLTVAVCFADCGLGDKGTEVYRVQVELLKQGFPVSRVDGNFDLETESLVKQFQHCCGLVENGFVDKDTYYSLLSRQELHTSVSPRVLRLLDIATLMLSTKFSWGGADSNGFDCSGFTEYCYGCIGVNIPRMADAQYEFGIPVRRNDLQSGDMVFFSTYEPGASHCGIYIGNNKFIHAGSSTGVTIADLNNVYWNKRYYGACRVLKGKYRS